MDNAHSLEPTILEAVAASRGHFVYESGHHGDLWLELDTLWVEVRRTQVWAAALAEPAIGCQPDFVCGPLTGGAFLAQLLAVEMGVGFIFAERSVSTAGTGQYRLAKSLQGRLSARRVLLVDDAVNAGSAWRLTLAELQTARAQVVGLACLLTLGPAASQIAGEYGVPLFTLASLERRLWLPEKCPLCRAGTPPVNYLAG